MIQTIINWYNGYTLEDKLELEWLLDLTKKKIREELKNEIDRYGDIQVYSKDINDGEISEVGWEYESEEDNLKYKNHYFNDSYIKKPCLILKG